MITKKILAFILAISVVLSVFSLSFSANALVDTSIKYGDVDGDGDVDLDDCMLALNSAAGLKVITDPEKIKRGDINSDGEITIYDARQILRCASSLVGLQPAGAFIGFNEEENYYATPEALIADFNYSLNRIKQELPGFDRQVGASVSKLNIEKVGSLGNAASGIIKTIEENLIEANEPEEATTFMKGENCDNTMSPETKYYVSKLTADNILGAKSSFDVETGYITMQVSIADCEIENVGQSAYGDVFNPDILQEKAQSVLSDVFGSTAEAEATRKQFKNAVLTVVVEKATGNVISYTTEYETEMFLTECNFLITKLYGVEYGTKVITIYNNFQW